MVCVLCSWHLVLLCFLRIGLETLCYLFGLALGRLKRCIDVENQANVLLEFGLDTLKPTISMCAESNF